VLAATLALPLALPAPAAAWGRRIHEIINRRAALETGAAEAWGGFAHALGAHASDADDRKGRDPEEPPRHYIDIDHFEPWPFAGVPRTREGMEKKYGVRETAQWGVAPWAIDECWRMVVRSLEVGDWGSAGAWAADLGHYVADTHQPLHCTVNYDGQASGNTGVHLRFEVHMMNRHFEESGEDPGPPPVFTGTPAEASFDWIAKAYPGLEVILQADSAATAVDPDFGDAYHAALWSRTEAVATTQVSEAVRDLAALYASAWDAAGRPAPPAEPPPFRHRTAEELSGPADSGGLSWKAVALAGAVVVAGVALGGR
jgi:hypothetical protein